MRIFYLSAVFILCSLGSFAQGTTGFSGTGANIDVENYQIWWRINPDSALGIKGIVTVKFRTTVANVTSISLDLRHTGMFVDSTMWQGNKVDTVWVGNTFSVPVNIPLSGTRDSLIIAYHGAPPVPSGAAEGFTKTTGAGGNVVYTLSESYEDRDWWPCKADMQDKADTIDMTINVPWKTNNNNLNNANDTFWVASNGTLVDSTIDVSGTQASRNRTFKYINRYPMASYLVCLGIARYSRYYRGTVDLGGGVNVPVVYYLYAGKSAGTYTNILTAMDKATECVAKFSQKFGNYGFSDPLKGGKHGFYEGLSGGGMEHQTFSAIATTSTQSINVLIHELMHQWFGDKVSFSTWNDLWLAEGFAEYGPILAAELVSGTGSTPYGLRSGIQAAALAEAAPVQIPNSGIVNSDNIWVYNNTALGYGRSVYNRGAMIVSMLRTLAGDSKFFNVMKDYQMSDKLAFASAKTDTLRRRFADSLGIDMSGFFNDNVINTGYPDYNIGYQYFGVGNKKLALSVASQSRINSTGVTYFRQPVVVHVKGPSAGNDTTIVFYDWGGGNLSKAGNGVTAPVSGNSLTYQLSFAPNWIRFDDSLRTMSTGTMSPLTIVDLKILDFNARKHTNYNDASLLLDDNSVHATVILERSGDGVNFEELGNMVLQASANTAKRYLFNDQSPLKNDNYYRAKYMNADGIFIYSRIIKLGAAMAPGFVILNNPVHDVLQIKTADAAGKNILFSIYDMSSKHILTREVKNTGNITDIALPVLVPGVYLLQVKPEGAETQNMKFMIK